MDGLEHYGTDRGYDAAKSRATAGAEDGGAGARADDALGLAMAMTLAMTDQ